VLVSDSLREAVRGWRTDSVTRFSDHQPVCTALG